MGPMPKQGASAAATLAAALAMLALPACLGGATPAHARPLATGIADPLSTDTGDPLVFSRVRQAGSRFVRLTALWHTIAPAARPVIWNPTSPLDPSYRWSQLDGEVRAAVQARLTPLIQVYGAPSWANRCQIQNDADAPCDPDPAAFGDFATALARRYDGSLPGLPRVRYFQAENEPNLFLFFKPQRRNGRPVSPRLYRALLNRFGAAVKSVHGSNRVVAAGLAPLKRPGSIAPLDFARRLLCMRGRRHPRPAGRGCGKGVRFDIFSVHPYTTGGPTHSARGRDDVSLGDLPEVRRLLRAADRAHRIRGAFRHTPLWITEFGWDTNPPDPNGLRMGIAARWASEALYRAWLAGVKAFFWYELRDNPADGAPNSEVAQSGLWLRGATLAEDRPKGTLEAFRFPLVAFGRARGTLVWGRTPHGRAGDVKLQARRGRGRWRGLRRAHAGRGGIFRVRLHKRLGKRYSARAVFRGEASVPFSLRRVPDFYQPPFGRYASGLRRY